MQPLPHHYSASIAIDSDAADVVVQTQRLPDLVTNAPAEYDGPGDRWSPETLLIAAVADCFVLGFRAIARASKLEWRSLSCDVTGTLDKVDGVTRFVHLDIHARLGAPESAQARAGRILQKAKDACLITNSLRADIAFTAAVEQTA